MLRKVMTNLPHFRGSGTKFAHLESETLSLDKWMAIKTQS